MFPREGGFYAARVKSSDGAEKPVDGGFALLESAPGQKNERWQSGGRKRFLPKKCLEPVAPRIKAGKIIQRFRKQKL